MSTMARRIKCSKNPYLNTRSHFIIRRNLPHQFQIVVSIVSINAFKEITILIGLSASKLIVFCQSIFPKCKLALRKTTLISVDAWA